MKWWEYMMLFAVVVLNLGTLGVYMKICEDTQKSIAIYEKRLDEFEKRFNSFEKKYNKELPDIEKKLDNAIKHSDMVLDSVMNKRW